MISKESWHLFYSNIKDPSWPDCPTINDIDTLPDFILKEILSVHVFTETASSLETDNIVRAVQSPDVESTLQINDVQLFFNENQNGGGSIFYKEYLDIIRQRYPERVFDNCFEWCAGPGFIGFSLLANNFCKNLYLGECYDLAVASCQATIDHLPDRLKTAHCEVIQLSQISALPPHLKFDLVVGNPPWYGSSNVYLYHESDQRIKDMAFDLDWEAHKEFFNNIKSHLTDDGIIILVEGAGASSPMDFQFFVESNNLKIIDTYQLESNEWTYYIEITHA